MGASGTSGAVVSVDGIEVAYTDLGEGPPLVLMHGNPDSRAVFTRLIDELGGEDTGFRILCPDFPGYGDSSEPGPGFDFGPAGLARFWGACFEGVGLDEPATVVVHDFGSLWLLPWVAAHPDRVAGLVVTNASYDAGFEWHFWARVWQTPVIGEISTMLSTRSLFRREMRKGDPALPAGYPDEAFEASTPGMKRTMLRSYRAYRDLSGLDPWRERLDAAIAALPRAVVWGDLDPYIPARFADAWGVEAVHLPEVGHWVHVSRPDVVAGAIRSLAGR